MAERSQPPKSRQSDKTDPSDKAVPLPTLMDPTTFGLESEPSAGDLAEMVALQRSAVDDLRECTGDRCAELTAQTRTLKLLVKELDRRVPKRGARGLYEGIRRAQDLADIFPNDPITSERPNVGPAVTAVKKLVVKGLKPFHIEMLRTQYHFNLELVDVIRTVAAQQSSSLYPDLADWARARLSRVSNPAVWTLRSHRGKAAAFAVKMVKSTYLSTMRPVLEDVLEGQRLWNVAAMAAISALASWEAVTPSAASRLLSEVATRSDPVSRDDLMLAARAMSPIWKEIFRRQTAFNEEILRIFSEMLGVATPQTLDYQAWCVRHEREEMAKTAFIAGGLRNRPVISIVTPVYETPEPVLRACLESVLGQIYPHWELCVADDGSKGEQVTRVLAEYARRDPRIRVARLPGNSGIARATNSALALATGEFVAFLDHDDLLAPHALAEVALKLEAETGTDVVYSDEDHVDSNGRRLNPFFKPDWSPDLLRASSYFCHLLVVRRSLLEKLKGIREGFDGAQDYDLALRLSEKTQRIAHIPKILYHWRETPASTAANPENKPDASNAGVRALTEHLKRCGVAGEASATLPTTYRVKYPIKGKPLVSIIVPYKDKPELLDQLVTSLLKLTTYSNFELLLISNNSQSPKTEALLARLTDRRIRKLKWDHPFNYSAINNFGAENAKGQLLLFLNNDIEVTQADWMEELIGQALRPEVGAVGPKLLYPDGTIQHAGVVVGLGGFAGHVFARMPSDPKFTAFGHENWTRNYLAVTSACVMMRREVFDSLGGYDTRFTLCGSDVEICLRMNARGLRVVYTPHAVLTHHESATRASDAIPEHDFWRSFVAYRPWLKAGDPYYNQNLSLDTADGALRNDDRTAEDLSVQVLSRELPGSSTSATSLARAEHLRHIADHITALDYSGAQIRKARVQIPTGTTSMIRAGKLKTITWLVPYFEHPYGGVHTILRFGSMLNQRHGVQSRFVVYDAPHGALREIEARVATLFPTSPGEFEIMRSARDLEDLPRTDLAVATLWNSAYLLLNHVEASAKAYFVQDFEPLFYPAGTFYALTEQTYRMGLYGIFNTQGLHDYVTSNYPMKGCWFEPSVDHHLFHDARPKREGPVRVFFYARPSTDRNAFELGLAALKQLKRALGAGVEIICAGEHWRPEDFGVGGKINNLGVLPYEKTADLYRSCDVGLALMFTKHPSYLPLEMMACGMTVVTNNNPANLWLFDHGRNCLLAEPTVSCMAEQLEKAASDPTLRNRVGRSAAERLRRTTWEEQVDQVYGSLTGHAVASEGGVVEELKPRAKAADSNDEQSSA